MTLNPIIEQRQFLVACEQNSPEFSGLYNALIHEEWNTETLPAAQLNNRVAMFDGLLDTVYVLAGRANTMFDSARDIADFLPTRELVSVAETVAWAMTMCEVETAKAEMEPWKVVFRCIRAAEYVWALGLRLGFPMEAGWHEVHASNMAKVDKETGKVIRREDGKILKPEGWVGPNLAAVLAGEPGNYAAHTSEVV
jgi:hypothetical protein